MKFVEIVKDVYLLRTPFSTVTTGIVLLRGKVNILIDSGADEPEVYLIPALQELGLAPSDIGWLLHTHSHGDHITGHYTLATKYGVPVASADFAVKNLTDPAANAISIRTRFPAYSPPPQSWLRGVTPTLVVGEGEAIADRLFPIHTPGHDHDCMCWYDIPTKTIITGDSLQGNGTPTQGIGFYRSLSEYKQTLRKLRGYDIENIICGHDYDGIGEVIYGKEAVSEALSRCEEYVVLYDAFVRAHKDEGLSDAELAERLIRESGCGMPEKLFLALYTITQHKENL